MKHRIKVGSPRKTVAQRAKNFDLLMEHFKICCEPFYFVKVDAITMEPTVKPMHTDGIDEDKSLLNMVAQFVKQNPKHVAEAEARQAKEAKREAKLRQLEAMAERSNSKAKEDDEKTGGEEKSSILRETPQLMVLNEAPKSPTPKNNLLYLQ